MVKMKTLSEQEGLKLAHAAKSLLQAGQFNPTGRYRSQELSLWSGVDGKLVERVLSRDTSADELVDSLRGRDWERLLSAAAIYPEDWLNRAQIKWAELDEPTTSRYLAGTGRPPSEGTDKKIRALLSATNAFYRWASQKYIKRHGKLDITLLDPYQRNR